MSKTDENLQAAFAGESQANRRYLAFAKKAEEEGYPQIAKLFRAAAAAETIHAHNYLKVMGVVGSTEVNLKAAIAGEHEEFTRMYPEFIKQADAEGAKEAREFMSYASMVEKTHHQLLQSALAKLRADAKFADYDYYICSYCGQTVAGEPLEVCPTCGRPREWFRKVD